MSGHPLGLFHSHKMAPRVIITNGLMVGTFDDQQNFNREPRWAWPTTAR
jgi:urocanate hydratase